MSGSKPSSAETARALRASIVETSQQLRDDLALLADTVNPRAIARRQWQARPMAIVGFAAAIVGGTVAVLVVSRALRRR